MAHRFISTAIVRFCHQGEWILCSEEMRLISVQAERHFFQVLQDSSSQWQKRAKLSRSLLVTLRPLLENALVILYLSMPHILHFKDNRPRSSLPFVQSAYMLRMLSAGHTCSFPLIAKGIRFHGEGSASASRALSVANAFSILSEALCNTSNAPEMETCSQWKRA